MDQEEQAQSPAKPAGEAAPQGEAPDNRRRHGSRRPRFRRGPGRGDRDRDQGDRAAREQRGEPPKPGEEAQPGQPTQPRKPGNEIRRAMELVDRIRGALRGVLDDMTEVLRVLDQVEREKSATEEEIESLRDALDRLHYNPPPQRYQAPRPPQPREEKPPADAEENQP